MWNKLEPLIHACFDEGGLLANGVNGREFKFNKQQLEYALSAGQGFCGKQNILPEFNVIQAGTGTGKTLGYLIPLMLYSAISGKRVGVSTFTRHLQHQVIRDGEIANALCEKLLGKRLEVRKRLGRKNYLSPDAIRHAVSIYRDEERLTAEIRELLSDALGWANDPETSGLLIDFLFDHGLESLPDGLPESYLVLQANDSEDNAVKYLRDVEMSKAADVVVLNHATMCAAAFRWGEMIRGEDGIDALVADEADRLESVAEGMMGADFSIYEATGIAKKIDEVLGGKLMTPGIKAISEAVNVFERESNGGIVAIDGGSRFSGIYSSLKSAAKQLTPAIAEMMKIHNASSGKARVAMGDLVVAAEGMRDVAIEIAGILSSNQSNSVIVTWSPIRRYPSIRIGVASPGHVFGKLWTKVMTDDDMSAAVNKVLFTSATLPVTEQDAPECFYGFLNELGIYKQSKNVIVRGELCRLIEARNFGRLSFVLADQRIPNPISANKGSDEFSFDEEWSDYAADMVLKAASKGGRVLVLVPSYRDQDWLAPRLDEIRDRLIIHEKGTRIQSYLTEFCQDESRVMITPAGWEGLDLPGMIRHVAIPRLPYENSENTSFMIKKNALSKVLERRVVNNIIQRTIISRVKQKLGQGMGRIIRKSDDYGTVWIGDPRFPLPDKYHDGLSDMMMDAVPRQNNKSLVGCIPKRFSKDYEDASVFLKNR